MAKYEDSWCQEAYDRGFKEGRDFEKGKLTNAKELLKKWIEPKYNGEELVYLAVTIIFGGPMLTALFIILFECVKRLFRRR